MFSTLGSPSEALRFYADVGYPIPAHTNPADFFIQTLAIIPGDEEKCIERCSRIINAVLKFLTLKILKYYFDEILIRHIKIALK